MKLRVARHIQSFENIKLTKENKYVILTGENGIDTAEIIK
ncbi:MAG: hypothetical protein ACI8Q1_002749 [Parvicella sp.]|jgi:hypothetical protein